jgi:hypothetical protein
MEHNTKMPVVRQNKIINYGGVWLQPNGLPFYPASPAIHHTQWLPTDNL